LRDYARGVIEIALRGDATLQVDATKIRSPYKSEWIGDVPSKEDLVSKYDTWKTGRSDDQLAQSEIVNSVMDDDFARYVIGTNSGHFDWTSRRLDEAGQPTRREIYEKFVASLTARQRQAFDELTSARENFDVYLRMDEGR